MAHEKHPEEILNPDGAMENVKALLQVVNHLDADIDKGQTEPLLFHGLIITIPTLLGLATELALKALHMREVATAPKFHDLIELFDQSAGRHKAPPRKKDARGAASPPPATVGIPRHSRRAPSKPNPVRGMAIPARTLPSIRRDFSVEGSAVGDHRHVRRTHTAPLNSVRPTRPTPNTLRDAEHNLRFLPTLNEHVDLKHDESADAISGASEAGTEPVWALLTVIFSLTFRTVRTVVRRMVRETRGGPAAVIAARLLPARRVSKHHPVRTGDGGRAH